MKRFIAVILNIFCTVAVFGQNGCIKIGGKILDNDSKKPLAYASISIDKSSIGTVSNEAGAFNFYIPSNLKEDTLVISHVGYETLKIKVTNSRGVRDFYLKESTTTLAEIVVSATGAKSLIEKAFLAIPQVYATEPYLMEGFHRSWERINFADSITYPGTLIEAAVTIYDPGYGKKENRKFSEEIYINEIRRSALMDGWSYNKNALRQLLNENLVRHNKSQIIDIRSFLNFPNSLTYEFEGATKINNENITIIKIETTNDKNFSAAFRVYLSDEDLAILRIELYGETKEINYTEKYIWQLDTVSAKFIFKRHLNKLFLSYAQTKYFVKKIDPVRKSVIQTEEYFRELLINNVVLKDVNYALKALGAKSGSRSIALKAGTYNHSFWENYNLIQENPVDEEVIQFFEKKGKLKNQFRRE